MLTQSREHGTRRDFGYDIPESWKAQTPGEPIGLGLIGREPTSELHEKMVERDHLDGREDGLPAMTAAARPRNEGRRRH